MDKYPINTVNVNLVRTARRRGIPRVLIGAALACAFVLLFSSIRGLPEQQHAYLSALPLALAGIGYALLQIVLRPALRILFKRLVLAATFVAWAVDQLLPVGPAAIFIGDLVIAAYVLDLYWIIQEQIDKNVHES